MTANGVDVSVLIPVLNGERHLPEALERMLGQEFDGEFELLFIDGESTDRTGELLAAAAARDQRVRVLRNPAQRTPHALNVGLREARGEFVARMDAHTHYPADYLKRGVQRLRRGDVEWVAGPQLAAGSGRWSRRVSLVLSSPLGTGGASFRRAGGEEFEARTGFTGVWRRETLERHGGWDEGWPVNQDSELAARVRAAGERIVCVPGMAADYIPRDSLRELARQYSRYGFYRCKTSVRHPESMRAANLLSSSLVLAGVSALLAPGFLRRPTRLAVALYVVTVGVEGGRLARRSGRPSDAIALPLVFATMHVSNGFGFLSGCLRFGPPLRAIARLVRSVLRV
jgi:succinoglycan biosynthesis protein ExoA